MQEWCAEIDAVTDLLQIVLEHGLRSITVRLLRELSSRNIPVTNIPVIDVSEQSLENLDPWVSSIHRGLRLFGFYCLFEVSVCSGNLNHM